MSSLTRDYSKFDGEWFLDTYYKDLSGYEEDDGFLLFMMKGLHGIFSSGKINGNNLLDIGTGPTIHTVISATPYVQNIYLSDYNRSNRDILQDWVDGKRDHGKNICKYFLEQESSSQNVDDRIKEIREKVKSIHPIDVTKWPMSADDIPKPDVIVSSLCFESACESLEEYTAVVKSLNLLLPPGGHLVVAGVLDETFYRVGDFRFYCLTISESKLKEIYNNNGFEIKVWHDYIPPMTSFEGAEYADFRKAFVMYARKL